VWRRQCIGSWWGMCRERERWGDLGVDVFIILEWICGERAVYRLFLLKREGKRPLGRPWRRGWIILRLICGYRVFYSFLLEKPDGRRPLGRPRRRWVYNIRMHLVRRGCIGSWWGNRRERDHWGT